MANHNKASTSRHHHHHHQGIMLQQENHQQNQIHHHHQMRHQNNNQISFGGLVMQSSASANPGTFNISKDGGAAYDLGELDQALFLYLDDQEQSVQDQRQINSGMRPHTLNIFPSQPMHAAHEPSEQTLKAASDNNTGLAASPSSASGSKRSSEPSTELLSNPAGNDNIHHVASASEPSKVVKRKGPNSTREQDGPKTPDPKTLRRLAQNREAARKSRLRKKAYVQQLETSRVRLTQLEQEIHRTRTQGFHLGLGGEQQGLASLSSMGNVHSDAALFDMEYARWLEDHHRLMVELRNAVQENLPENDLRVYVENTLAHYDQLMSLKGILVKSDVFHIFSGTWKTPAERCFLWMGGFRPSEIIKIILSQIGPLSEQQLVGICGLQQSTQEAEEALSHGLEALNQSLNQSIVSESLSVPPNMNTYMGQMALAINKLSTLEGFVREGDNLRHQTLHRLHQILTARQTARCFLAMAEYFHRLRALSSLWLGRPRQ